jgi:putative sterol carrier protein
MVDLRGPRDIADSFVRLGENVARARFAGIIRVQLRDKTEAGENVSHFTVTVANGKARIEPEAGGKPDVEFITTSETWMEIASGKLAAPDAFFAGRMRVRGKMRLTRDMLKRVAASHAQRGGLRK